MKAFIEAIKAMTKQKEDYNKALREYIKKCEVELKKENILLKKVRKHKWKTVKF